MHQHVAPKSLIYFLKIATCCREVLRYNFHLSTWWLGLHLCVEAKCSKLGLTGKSGEMLLLVFFSSNFKSRISRALSPKSIFGTFDSFSAKYTFQLSKLTKTSLEDIFTVVCERITFYWNRGFMFLLLHVKKKTLTLASKNILVFL